MSDTSSSIYCIQQLTGVENYSTWKVKMLDILTDMGLYGYALGNVTRPADQALQPDWDKKDRQALSAIRLQVGDDPLIYICDATTSSSAWTTLADMYLPNEAIGIVQARRKLFRAQCQEGEEISKHIRTMIHYRKELTSLGSKLSEDEFAITLLTSLPDSWDTFIQGVDTSSLTDSTKLIAHILKQSHRKSAKPSSDDVALAAKFNSKPRNHNNTFNPLSDCCFKCGCAGHHSHECRNSANGKTFTPEQKKRNYERTSRKQRSNPKKGNRTHLTQKSQEPSDDYAFMASTDNGLPPDTWLIDSACTSHIIRNKSHFSSYIETLGQTVKGFGKASTIGKGTAVVAAHFSSKAFNITLPNSLHVPDAPYNLISVACITQAGFTVKFFKDHLSIYSPGPSSHKIIHGKCVGNLYTVCITPCSPRFSPQSNPPPSPTPSDPETLAFPAKPAACSWKDWHCAFGHISPKSIKLLHDKNMVSGMLLTMTAHQHLNVKHAYVPSNMYNPFPVKPSENIQRLVK